MVSLINSDDQERLANGTLLTLTTSEDEPDQVIQTGSVDKEDEGASETQVESLLDDPEAIKAFLVLWCALPVYVVEYQAAQEKLAVVYRVDPADLKKYDLESFASQLELKPPLPSGVRKFSSQLKQAIVELTRIHATKYGVWGVVSRTYEALKINPSESSRWGGQKLLEPGNRLFDLSTLDVPLHDEETDGQTKSDSPLPELVITPVASQELPATSQPVGTELLKADVDGKTLDQPEVRVPEKVITPSTDLDLQQQIDELKQMVRQLVDNQQKHLSAGQVVAEIRDPTGKSVAQVVLGLQIPNQLQGPSDTIGQ